MNSAVDLELISKNPLRAVKRLHEPRHRERYLSADEEARLLEALAPDVRPIVELAVHTGIRLSALLGLRWRDVVLRLPLGGLWHLIGLTRARVSRSSQLTRRLPESSESALAGAASGTLHALQQIVIDAMAHVLPEG